MDEKKRVKVLFVCMGNICRSPTAEGVFADLVRRQGLADLVEIDSAGTHAYHVGELPDSRARKAALNRGIDLSGQRARRVDSSDFARFDYILAMDEENLDGLLYACPDEFKDRVRLFLDYAPGLSTRNVPDPYYGGNRGFEKVLDLVSAASEGLLDHIRERDL